MVVFNNIYQAILLTFQDYKNPYYSYGENNNYNGYNSNNDSNNPENWHQGFENMGLKEEQVLHLLYTMGIIYLFVDFFYRIMDSINLLIMI